MELTGIVAFDPGIESTGFGVLTLSTGVTHGQEYLVKHVEHGTINTHPKAPLEKRCLEIFVAARGLLCKHLFLFVALEEYFVGPNRKTAALVLQAKGALLVASAAAGKPVRTLAPSTIKKALTGKGNAGKAAVREEVERRLDLRQYPVRNDHESDALAIGIASLLLMNDADKAMLMQLRKEVE